jgi:hypothetical protein
MTVVFGFFGRQGFLRMTNVTEGPAGRTQKKPPKDRGLFLEHKLLIIFN